MATPFTSVVRTISDGNAVNAATTNAGTQDLTNRTQSLLETLQGLQSNSLLKLINVPLQAGMIVGTSVYFDTVSSSYLPAEGALATDVVGGYGAPSAFIAGMLVNKTTDTLGDVGIQGMVLTLTTVQLAAIMDGGVFAAGQYFLSEINPGNISINRGSLSIYVGQALPSGEFLLRPTPPVEGQHEHFEFDLSGAPAGTVVDPTSPTPQTIAVPDTSLRGWLPATSTYFSAPTIPVGAYFGYNITNPADAALLAVFPPLPLSGAFFAQGGEVLTSAQITVNQFGIWWMTDAYGTAPWPVNYNAMGQTTSIQSWFSRLLAATSTGTVTSLQKHPSSVLNTKFVDASGNPQTGGNLLLRVDNILTNTSTTDVSGTAVKSITGGGFTSGPIVGRLFPGAGVTLTGTGSVSAGFSGDVTVASSNSNALQGYADVVDLSNARYDIISNVSMVTLPLGRNASPVFSVYISNLAPTVSTLTPVLWLYSSYSGAIPSGFVVQYRIVTPSATNTALPTGWTTLTSIVSTAVVVNQARLISLSSITGVPVGALVLIQVVRAGSTDSVNGNLGIISLGYNLQ